MNKSKSDSPKWTARVSEPEYSQILLNVIDDGIVEIIEITKDAIENAKKYQTSPTK